MPMAVVGPASPADRAPPVLPTAHPAAAAAAAAPAAPAVPLQPPPAVIVSDAYAKDLILSWFRSEFAAANAIIDALCGHLSQLGGVPDYEAVFQAVHRRRMNWVPVLHMQEFHSVAEVVQELTRVAARKLGDDGNKSAGGTNATGVPENAPTPKDVAAAFEKEQNQIEPCVNDNKKESESAADEKAMEMSAGNDSGNGEVIDVDEEEDSPDSDITDSGSQEVHHVPEEMELCSNHELCESRLSQIKLTKGFAAREPVRGHMVNLVKGMKLYENVFTDSEVSKLTHFVTDLRIAGQNGELSGETYILFNKQIKGNKRELLQFGVPIFGHRQEDAMGNNETSNIQPIPSLLQGVIDHLVQWQLLPVYKQPNSCIINFFDEGEYSQPFWKPPHLDQPISTLFLSESTLVFGRFLVNDGEGNYKGKFTLTPKEGSFLVMRGNSCDMARHATCPSPNKRIAISFFRVRPVSNPTQSSNGPLTMWNPTSAGPYNYEPMDMAMSNWGLLPAPVVMLAPVPQMALSPKKILGNGTGVFLPWNGSHRKPVKHLPPRAQRGRVLHLAQAVETHVAEPASA